MTAKRSALVVGSLCLDTSVRFVSGISTEVGQLTPVRAMSDSVGGCGGNVAIGLAALGVDVTLAALVADDAPGAVIEKKLQEVGVSLGVEPLPAPARTARSVVLVDSEGGERSFLYAGGINEKLSRSHLSGFPLGTFDALVLTDPYLTTLGREQAGELLDIAAKAGVLTVVSLVWDPTEQWSVPWRGFRGPDILIASAQEAFALVDSRDATEATEGLLELGAGFVVVTQGSLGLTAGTRDGIWHVSAGDAAVVDPTGAGDWCTAACVAAILAGQEPSAAARYAAEAGACAVQAVGGSSAVGTDSLREAIWCR